MRYLTYKDALQMVICNPPTDKCYLRKCDLCPGTDELTEMMEVNFDFHGQSDVKFREWTTVDRCELLKSVLPNREFITKLVDQIPSVLEHDLMAKKQSSFIKKKKELQEGECLAIGDFSENFTPVYQDAVQKVHWSDIQVTIHPFIAYYKKDGQLQFFSYVVVSDTTSHLYETVNTFQRELVAFLQERLGVVIKIYYFSDGAAQQYKNRKMAFHLRNHFKEFGVGAEWHFFATSHGKGPCDGLAGAMERLATRESLQRVKDEERITTPFLLYEWAVEKFKGTVKVVYISQEAIDANTIKYFSGIEKFPEVTGIKSAHAVIAHSENVIELKPYSLSEQSQYKYFGQIETVQFEDIHGFVLVHHESSWALAKVEDKTQQSNEIKLKIMRREGARNSLIYKLPPLSEATVIKRIDSIISICNAESTDGTYYRIPQGNQRFANQHIIQR